MGVLDKTSPDGVFLKELEGEYSPEPAPSIVQQGHDLWIQGPPRRSHLNFKEGLGRLLRHAGMAAAEGQGLQHLGTEALKAMAARRRGQCGADGGLSSPPPHPPLRVRPPHQQRPQPARLRGLGSVEQVRQQGGGQGVY
jgi:hypothetical protein